jgi:hypothetical protein
MPRLLHVALVTVLPLALLCSCGCRQRSSKPALPGSTLLLRLEFGGGLTRCLPRVVRVYADGKCTLEDGEEQPIGDFATNLDASEMAAVTRAVGRVSRCPLRARYEAGIGEADAGFYHLEARRPDGTYLVSTYSAVHVPDPTRPLWDAPAEGKPHGLVPHLISLARQHPVHALDLAIETDRAQYRAGDSARVTFVFRNAGAQPITVVPTTCHDLASGGMDVMGTVYSRQEEVGNPDSVPLQHEAALECWQFGAKEEFASELAALSPGALADIGNLRLLQPAESFRVLFPKPLRLARTGYWELIADCSMRLRYAPELVEGRAAASLVTGALIARARVSVSPR